MIFNSIMGLITQRRWKHKDDSVVDHGQGTRQPAVNVLNVSRWLRKARRTEASFGDFDGFYVRRVWIEDFDCENVENNRVRQTQQELVSGHFDRVGNPVCQI